MLHVLLCESSKPCRVLACRLYCVCMLCTWLPGSPLGCPPASQHPFPSTQSSTATTHLYTALMVNKAGKCADGDLSHVGDVHGVLHWRDAPASCTHVVRGKHIDRGTHT
eukprot:1140190-Pelagomonas_calceolata.AAC.2